MPLIIPEVIFDANSKARELVLLFNRAEELRLITYFKVYEDFWQITSLSPSNLQSSLRIIGTMQVVTMLTEAYNYCLALKTMSGDLWQGSEWDKYLDTPYDISVDEYGQIVVGNLKDAWIPPVIEEIVEEVVEETIEEEPVVPENIEEPVVEGGQPA